MAKVAVIFLPGILGSPLFIDGNKWFKILPHLERREDPMEAWPVHSLGANLLTERFFSMPLIEKLERFIFIGSPFLAQIASARASDNSDSVAPFYRDFVAKAADNLKFEHGVHVIHYDWTRTIQESAAEVWNKTEALLRVKKYSHYMYVTHSMGGLVAMEVIRRQRLWGPSETFVGAVRAACPVFGAPETLARMHRGIRTTFTGHISDNIAEAVGAGILGNEGWRFSLLAACIPGVISLLPTKWVQWTEVNSVIEHHAKAQRESQSPDDAWRWYETMKGWVISGMSSSWTAACNFHRGLEQDEQRIRGSVTAVVLSGREKTILSFRKWPVNPADVADPVFGDGDGTVPLNIQAAISENQFTVTGGIEHASAFVNSNTFGTSDNLLTIYKAMNDRYNRWQDRP